MVRLSYQLSNHSLLNTNIPIESSTKRSPKDGHPNIGRKSYRENRDNRASRAQEKHWFPSDAIRERTP